MARLVTEDYNIKDVSDACYADSTFVSDTSFGQSYSYRLQNTSALYAVSALTEFYFAFSFYTDCVGAASNTHVFAWRNGSTYLGSLRAKTDGKLAYVCNTDIVNGADTSTSATQCLYKNVVVTVEGYVKIDDSAGVVQIKVDGVQVINYSGDTKPSTQANVDNLGVLNNNSRLCSYGWLVINDTTGGADNGWPGILKFKSLLPNADGAETGWTASSGSRYQCVDENAHTGDTDYIYSTTNAQRNSFAFASAGLGSHCVVKSMIGRHMVRKESSGQVTPFFRVSSTDYDGTLKDVGISYAAITDRRTTNPNTSNPWAYNDNPEIGVLSTI